MNVLVDLLQGCAVLALGAISVLYAVTWVGLGIVTHAGVELHHVGPRKRDQFAAGLILWGPMALLAGAIVAVAGRAL